MAEGNSIKALNLVMADSNFLQQPFEQGTASLTRFAIYEFDFLPRKVFDTSHAFRIAGGDHKTLFPAGKGEHAEIAARKFLA